jgi:hypothetical protein
MKRSLRFRVISVVKYSSEQSRNRPFACPALSSDHAIVTDDVADNLPAANSVALSQ